MFENGLWVIVLEMFAAIGMGAFIVWWTWPRKPRPKTKPNETPNEKPGAE